MSNQKTRHETAPKTVESLTSQWLQIQCQRNDHARRAPLAPHENLVPCALDRCQMRHIPTLPRPTTYSCHSQKFWKMWDWWFTECSTIFAQGEKNTPETVRYIQNTMNAPLKDVACSRLTDRFRYGGCTCDETVRSEYDNRKIWPKKITIQTKTTQTCRAMVHLVDAHRLCEIRVRVEIR